MKKTLVYTGLIVGIISICLLLSLKVKGSDDENLWHDIDSLGALKRQVKLVEGEEGNFEIIKNTIEDMSFVQYKINPNGDINYSFPLESPDLYYISKGNLQELSDYSQVPPRSIIYAKAQNGNFLFSMPYYINQLSQGNYRVKFEGDRKFEDSELSYQFKKNDYTGYFWYFYSEKEFLRESEGLISLLSEDKNIIIDGYYFASNDSYKPGGDGIYYRNPALYIMKTYKDIRLQKVLLYTLLSYMEPIITEKGYVPIPVEAQWLKDDYGIADNYYDNRWNSDLGEIIIDAYSKTKDPELLSLNQKIIEYTMNHIDENNYLIRDGAYLVADYGHDNKNYKKTHASLNHHLQVLNWFTKTYIETGDERIKKYSLEMLNGVMETGVDWIKENADLYYAYNGKEYIRDDYERLTYNDLMKTRDLIKSAFNIENSSINILIDSKRRWLESK